MTARIVEPIVFNGEDEVDVVRLTPESDGRVLVVIPIGCTLRKDEGVEMTTPELRLLAQAICLAADKADALAQRRADARRTVS